LVKARKKGSLNSNDKNIRLPQWMKQISTLVECLKRLLSHYFIKDRIVTMGSKCDRFGSSNNTSNYDFETTTGDEAISKALKISRLYEIFSRGGPRMGVSLQQKQLQSGIKKYVQYIVAAYLDFVHNKFPGIERMVDEYMSSLMVNSVRSYNKTTDDSHVSSIVEALLAADNEATIPKHTEKQLLSPQYRQALIDQETKKWQEALQILKRSVNPLLDVMGDAEKQTLYCTLHEPLRTNFKELQETFKKHYKFSGKV